MSWRLLGLFLRLCDKLNVVKGRNKESSFTGQNDVGFFVKIARLAQKLTQKVAMVTRKWFHYSVALLVC